VAGRDDLIGAFLDALSIELANVSGPCEVDTLFFGGGTPTHLAPLELQRLCELTTATFPLVASGEWSVEANPNDINEERLSVLRDAGVTRISLGAQSFNGEKLTCLERDHTAEHIRNAVALARSFGFQVSLDLIFAAPQETLHDWKSDLRQALELSPDHLSTYGLTYERGAMFYARLKRGELALLDEEVEAEMYSYAIETVTNSGYEHYEISSFAQPGKRCRHNEIYWTGRPYYAAGPGAARFINGRRDVNHRSTQTWIRRLLAGESPVGESEQLDSEESARERLVFGLRRLEGVDRHEFQNATGFRIESLGGSVLEDYLKQELLCWRNNQLRLTCKGLMVSDSLWPALL